MYYAQLLTGTVIKTEVVMQFSEPNGICKLEEAEVQLPATVALFTPCKNIIVQLEHVALFWEK